MLLICMFFMLFSLIKTTQGWIPLNIDGSVIATSNSNQLSSQRGTGIPWVESFGQERVRLLWESGPFEVVQEVVDDVIRKNACRPLLRVVGGRRALNCSSQVDIMFAPLFSEGNQSLDLPPPSLHHHKTSFALKVAYRGSDFCGWQTQPTNVKLPSVQQSLEEHLGLLDCSRVDIRVSGRTDAGVSAIGQICRFRTRNNISKEDLMAHLETFPLSSSFQCLEVQCVTDSFHPTFGATNRAYVYLVDDSSLSDVEVERLDAMLRHLENKTLDYLGLSYGKVKTSTTECTLRCSRACVLESSCGRRALCIQLVGDRFLRRMVRLLVATALSLSWERTDSQALLNMVQQQDRSLSSKAAPPDGLIFVGAEYDYTTL
jgi:tRNA pseudouridine(38-40) synthase